MKSIDLSRQKHDGVHRRRPLEYLVIDLNEDMQLYGLSFHNLFMYPSMANNLSAGLERASTDF